MKRSALGLVAALWVLSLGMAPVAGAAEDSAVIDAVRSGSLDRLRAVLTPGVNVNAPQGDGATALHWAAHRNDVAAADLLLRAGAAVNAANDLGATALWLASLNGSDAMVKRLLEAGANPSVTIESGETPLMAAARSGSAAAVTLLASHGADLNAQEQLRGQTALMWAADQRHPRVVRALVQAGADVTVRSRVWRQLENTAGNTNPSGDFDMEHGGSTALLFAVRRGDVESTRILLDAGADVNDTNAAGASALVVAAHSNQGDVGELLLARGADPNAAGAGYTALHAATLRGNTRLVRALLEKGADANALVTHGSPVRRLSADHSIRHQMIGLNALWIAARLGHVDIARALRARGAVATLVPKDGTPALKAAMGFVRGVTENREGRYGAPRLEHSDEERLTLELARLLLEAGVDVNATDNAGESALFDAARQRFDSVVEFLAAQGANVNVRNKRSQTPLTVLLTETYEAPPDSPVLNRQSTIDLLRKLGSQE
ncbi:MAG: ankyrin repeat domain-containing protein [Vicinamibacterales bacterium]